MKTAIQELMRFVDSFQEEAIHPRILRVKIKELLEKEKEQIIQAVEDTRGNIVPKMFINKNLSGQEYYNQTYNQQEDKTFKQKSKWTTQKQHIIDIMKADEDDGLYKLLDTDPDKKH